MEIRRIRPDDDAAAAGAVVQQAYFALPGYPRDDAYDRLLGEVAQRARDTDVIVAVDDEAIVGCLTFVSDAANPHAEFVDPEAVSFRYFGVVPAAQGRRVGQQMVQWCIDEGRRIGRQRVRIHTLESMAGAQRLYERMGFRRDERNDEDWDGIKGLAFVLEL